MSREILFNGKIQNDISTGYGNGVGRVEFKSGNFSFGALKEIARAQLTSTSSSLIEFTYQDGQTKTMGAQELRAARALRGTSLKRFIHGLTRQMERARSISISTEVQPQPHHLGLQETPFSQFLENLDSLDTI